MVVFYDPLAWKWISDFLLHHLQPPYQSDWRQIALSTNDLEQFPMGCRELLKINCGNAWDTHTSVQEWMICKKTKKIMHLRPNLQKKSQR